MIVDGFLKNKLNSSNKTFYQTLNTYIYILNLFIINVSLPYSIIFLLPIFSKALPTRYTP
jgi:hypothetical protein